MKIALKYNISNTVVISSISVFIVVIVIFLFKVNSDNNIESIMTRKIDSIYLDIAKVAENNLSVASVLSRNETVIEGYEIAYTGNISDKNSISSQRAREFLRQHLRPSFQQYESIFKRKLSFHLHLPPARSLVRIWRDKQTRVDGEWVDISDNLSDFRQSILDINTGKLSYVKGIETGSGGFVIRGIVPVYNTDGKQLGSAEVFSSFNELVSHWKSDKNENFAVFMDHRLLKYATSLSDPEKHKRYDEKHVYITSTDDKITDKFVSVELLDSLSDDKVVMKRFDNYRLALFPVFDYNDEKIGSILYSYDISDEIAAQNRIVTIMIVLILLIIIISIISVFIITGYIIKPLNKMTEIFIEATKGDLTGSYEVKNVNCSKERSCNKKDCPEYGKDSVLCFLTVGSYAKDFGKEVKCPSILSGKFKDCKSCPVYKKIAYDEISTLGAWFNMFIIQLRELVSTIKENTSNLLSGTNEISQSSQHLADNAHTLYTSVSSVNSSIDTISASINENTGIVIDVKELALRSANSAKEGQEAVNKTVESIRRIASFIENIQEIANDTNMLALNASIEAARAGESGKGFAVVAIEVRKLAENSLKIAEEIKEISRSGVSVAEGAGSVMSGLIPEITKTAEAVNSIADDFKKQASQMSNASGEISEQDKITQQLNASSEELASVAEEIASQSKMFYELIEHYKV